MNTPGDELAVELFESGGLCDSNNENLPNMYSTTIGTALEITGRSLLTWFIFSDVGEEFVGIEDCSRAPHSIPRLSHRA